MCSAELATSAVDCKSCLLGLAPPVQPTHFYCFSKAAAHIGVREQIYILATEFQQQECKNIVIHACACFYTALYISQQICWSSLKSFR